MVPCLLPDRIGIWKSWLWISVLLVLAFLVSTLWTCYFSAWCQDCLIPASSCTSLFAAWWITGRCRGGKRPSTLHRRNLKTALSIWTLIKFFPPTLLRRNLKAQQSPAILDLCLRKTRSWKSHNYIDYIVFRFLSVFRPDEDAKPAFSNSSSLKSVFKKLHFCDKLVWMVGLTIEIKKTRFQISFARRGCYLTVACVTVSSVSHKYLVASTPVN